LLRFGFDPRALRINWLIVGIRLPHQRRLRGKTKWGREAF